MPLNAKDSLDQIKDIYQDINEWLKFIEAKHAGLFAIWIALFVALLSENEHFSVHLTIYTTLLILLLLGAFINLISFMPFLNKSNFIRRICYNSYKKISGNKVFYQSVFVDTYSSDAYNATISCNKYKQLFSTDFDLSCTSSLLDDYIRQVIEVSTVATIKTYLFGLSIKYAIITSIIIIVGLIIA
ncbi:MAG: hypothetical protein LUK37_00170 [Clostridia bacterium]|nr:hypothetical protein [Clostridia bacterium]